MGAKTEVFTDNNFNRTQAVNEVLGDEIFGFQRVHALVVVLHKCCIQSARGHGIKSIPQRRNQLEVYFRAMHLGRMRVESNRHGIHTAFACALNARGNDSAVPIVHTVKVTDGDHRLFVAGNLRQAGPDLHCVAPENTLRVFKE
ncbi:Uncharacterised protein [Chlamydia trachomatis]|nr:Uncharacterised protein [Chlamydia trachomatis]